MFAHLLTDIYSEESLKEYVSYKWFFQSERFYFWNDFCWLDIEILIHQQFYYFLDVNSKILELLAAKVHDVGVERNSLFFLFNFYLFFAFFVFCYHSCKHWFLGLYFYDFPCSHAFGDGRVPDDEGGEFVFVIEVADEGTRVTLAENFISNNLHVHFRELTLRATYVFFDEFIQNFP